MSLFKSAQAANAIVTMEDFRERFRSQILRIASADPENITMTDIDRKNLERDKKFRKQVTNVIVKKLVVAMVDKMKAGKPPEIFDPKFKRYYDQKTLEAWALSDVYLITKFKDPKMSEPDPFRRCFNMLNKLTVISYDDGPVRILTETATLGELRLAMELHYSRAARRSAKDEAIIVTLKSVINDMATHGEGELFVNAVARHFQEIHNGSYNPYEE